MTVMISRKRMKTKIAMRSMDRERTQPVVPKRSG